MKDVPAHGRRFGSRWSLTKDPILPVPTSLWFYYVLITVIGRAVEWHQPANISQAHSLFPQFQSASVRAFKRARQKLRWSNAKCDCVLSSSSAGCISPDLHYLLHALYTTEVRKIAGNTGERDIEKCTYPVVAWHLPWGVHWVFSKGQTHSLHPYLHSFVCWAAQNWDFLHFSQPYIDWNSSPSPTVTHHIISYE